MTVREILIYPDPKLRKQAVEVTEFDDELKALVTDMAETMYAFKGIGLAAPQIGVLRRVVVMDTEDGKGLQVLINPKIIASSPDTTLVEEGCLSFPGFFEKVARHMWVRVEAQDQDGKTLQLELAALDAQCAQHEIEHLDGVVLVDNLGRAKRRWITKDLQKRKKRKNLRYAVR